MGDSNKLSGKSKGILLTLLILAQIVVMLICGNLKQGLFMDEIMSYQLANNYYGSLVHYETDAHKYIGVWHDPQYFEDVLVVKNNERFKYGSVWYNQEGDVHPPLYYALLHTVFSFMPNFFSKWIGILLNLALFIPTVVFLYLIISTLQKDKWLPLITSFFYGFSPGAISTVLFARMYMLATLFILIITYVHIRTISKGVYKWRQMLMLICCTALGTLTQYNFLVYLFFLAALVCLYYLIVKEYSNLFKYAFSILAGVATAFIIFPASLKHMFFGYRGTEAIGNLFTEVGWVDLVKQYLNTAGRLLMGTLHKSIVALLMLILVLWLIQRFLLRIKCAYDNNSRRMLCTIRLIPDRDFQIGISLQGIIFSLITVATTLFMVVIAKISPYVTGRYYYMVLPLLCAILVMSIFYFGKVITKNMVIATSAVLVFIISVSVFGQGYKYIEYFYTDGKAAIDSASQNQNLSCFYLYENESYETYSNYLELMKYKSTFILPCKVEDIDKMQDAAEQKGSSEKGVILYLPSNDQLDSNLQMVLDKTMFNSYEELFRFNGKVAYRIES